MSDPQLQESDPRWPEEACWRYVENTRRVAERVGEDFYYALDQGRGVISLDPIPPADLERASRFLKERGLS